MSGVSGLRAGSEGRPAASTDAAAPVPQPPRRLWLRVGVPALLLLAFAGVLLWAGRHALTPAVDVRVVAATAGPSLGGGSNGGSAAAVPRTAQGGVVAQAAGWIEPDPFPIYVSALTDGVVAEVAVLEGQSVAKGDVVARLVPDDARLAHAHAEAAVAEQRAVVATAEVEARAEREIWDAAIELEREFAKSGAALKRARAAIVRRDSEIAAAHARTAELRDIVGRRERELRGGANTEGAVEQARLRLATAEAEAQALVAGRTELEAAVGVAEAEHAAARRHIELRIEERQTRDLAGARLEAARAELRVREVALEQAALALERTEIRSPRDGIVVRRLVAPGDKLMMGMDSPHSAHVVHLYDPARLQVRVDVPLADATEVGVDQRAEVRVETMPDRVFTGAVSRLVHEADVQKNTVQVKVAIDDPAGAIVPETLARVRFLARAAGEGDARGVAERTGGGDAPPRSTGGRGTFVPRPLVVEQIDDGGVLWVLDKGQSTATRREVRLGGTNPSGWIEVLSGAQPGDDVIDARSVRLADGARVQVVGRLTDADLNTETSR